MWRHGLFYPGEKLIATDRQGRNNSSKNRHVTINHLEKLGKIKKNNTAPDAERLMSTLA
jgi:hypothetical protein